MLDACYCQNNGIDMPISGDNDEQFSEVVFVYCGLQHQDPDDVDLMLNSFMMICTCLITLKIRRQFHYNVGAPVAAPSSLAPVESTQTPVQQHVSRQ